MSDNTECLEDTPIESVQANPVKLNQAREDIEDNIAQEDITQENIPSEDIPTEDIIPQVDIIVDPPEHYSQTDISNLNENVDNTFLQTDDSSADIVEELSEAQTEDIAVRTQELDIIVQPPEDYSKTDNFSEEPTEYNLPPLSSRFRCSESDLSAASTAPMMTSLQHQRHLGGSTSSLASLDGSSRRYTAPPLAVGGRRESMVDSIERQRRMSSTAPKLKGLVVPGSGGGIIEPGGQRSRRSSVSGLADLPKIGQTKVDPNSLPTSGPTKPRRLSYQPLSASTNLSKLKSTSLDRRYSSMTPLKAMASYGDKRDSEPKPFMNGSAKVNGSVSADSKPPSSKPPPPPQSKPPKDTSNSTSNYVYSKNNMSNGTETTEEEDTFEPPPQIPKSYSLSAIPQTPPPSEDAIVFDRPKLNIQPKKKSTSSSSSYTSSLSSVPASPKSADSQAPETHTNLSLGFDVPVQQTKAPNLDEIVMHGPVKVQRKVYNPNPEPAKSENSEPRKTSVVEMSVNPQPLVVNTQNGSTCLRINLSVPESRQKTVETKPHIQTDVFSNNNDGSAKQYSSDQMDRFENAVENMSTEFSNYTPVVSQSYSASDNFASENDMKVEEIEEEEESQQAPALPTEAPPPIPQALPPHILSQAPSTFPQASHTSLPAPSHKKQDSFEDLLEMDLEKSPRGGYGGMSTSRDSSNFDSSEELDTPNSKSSSLGRPRRSGVMRTSREDLSAGDHLHFQAPPISPTPSDTDSGIYSTKAEHGKMAGER